MELIDNINPGLVNNSLKIKSKIKQTFKLILFIFSTNTHFLQAHDLFNGGCKNHCKESVKPLIMNKDLDNPSYKNKIEDDDSCLTKSLCRGWYNLVFEFFSIKFVLAL